MKILITGATGMLGRVLTKTLSQKTEYIIYAVSRKNQKDKFDNGVINWLCFDLTNLIELAKTISLLKPDLIIHCAAVVNVDQCEEMKDYVDSLNKGFIDIVSFNSPNTKIIFVSSDSVFDGVSGNYLEADETEPLNYYAKSKVDAEEKLINSELNYLILRTNIFGYHLPKSSSLVEWAIEKLSKSEKIGGFNDVYFNPLYVDQLSEIILKLIDLKVEGIINIASDTKLNKYDFLLEIAEVFGFDKKLIEKKSVNEFDFKAIRPENTTLNTGLLNKIIGFTPSLKDGIKKMYFDYLNDSL